MTPNINWQDYEAVNDEQQPVQENPGIDWNQYEAVEPEKQKVGKAESVLYGLAEAFLGIPGMIQYGVNEISKPIEQAYYGDEENQPTFEEENPLLALISKFPESKDEASRRLRTGTTAAVLGAPFGVAGILSGIVGSQAGQTVRELFGKEGKFDEFGWGEAASMGADILAGGLTGVAASLAKSAVRNTGRIPAVFGQGETALQRASIKNVVQGEKSVLDDIVNNFSREQISAFEQEAGAVAPNRYTDLTNSNLAGIQRQTENMHRQGTLSLISPLNVTPEQGGSAIQQSANTLFQENVIRAEQTAYTAAKESAENLTGIAPKTLAEAKKLRATLVANTPSKEQNPVVNYLNVLISDLETTTPASTTPASKILNAEGRPITAAQEVAESSAPTVKKANDMITLVQNGNQAVNYGSELREQSHRLIPIINTLREETGQALSKNPAAVRAYAAANTLHARNAETWGTRYMRNVRFAENPESIVSQTKKASNLRNLKQAIPNQEIQSIAERLVVDDITKSGSVSSNIKTVSDLSPELSVNAQNAAHELVNIKDPLTTPGGRAIVRNQVLKDAAQSINTGKRPDKILDLMSTPKGYNIVRESLHASPQGREMFQSFQRLFMEDLFSAVREPSGSIDFNKAKNIFKNPETRQVAQLINPGITRRFERLEGIATNLENNIALFSQPQTKTLIQSAMKNVKDTGIVGGILHAMHIPWPVIISLGLGKAAVDTGKVGYNMIERRLLSNPRSLDILEAVSKASTAEELAKQLPRLISEVDKKTKD